LAAVVQPKFKLNPINESVMVLREIYELYREDWGENLEDIRWS
jgi:hypothetical protein